MNYISILCNNRISTTKSVNCMPHSYLKVVGNLGYRCNNSSPRYSVRTTMPSLYPN